MRGDTKEDTAYQQKYFQWSDQQITISRDLLDGLTPGIVRIGAAYANLLPFMVGYLIEFTDQWKELEQSKQSRLLRDPWEFKRFATQLDLRGTLFPERPNSHVPQREALLHLVYPDTFEGTVSIPHKDKIVGASAFSKYVIQRTEDVDRKIEQIRGGLEKQLGRDFDFYEDDIWRIWNQSTVDLWDDFVRRAEEYVNSCRLEKEEVNYKLEIGRKLAEARESVLADDEDWGSKVKAGVGSNLIHHIEQAEVQGLDR